jgi:hypothetical protein
MIDDLLDEAGVLHRIPHVGQELSAFHHASMELPQLPVACFVVGNQDLLLPAHLPLTPLGHDGAGEVEEIGSGKLKRDPAAIAAKSVLLPVVFEIRQIVPLQAAAQLGAVLDQDLHGHRVPPQLDVPNP